MTTTTSIKLCSNALVLLGHNPISSFDEAGAGALVASNLYESTLVGLISGHRWNFTKKKANLARLTAAPLNTWQYQYQTPSDMLQLLGTVPTSDYAIFGDKIYSNQTTLSIDYIYRPDETYFPPLFTEALEYLLASKFAIPVTDSETKANTYFNMYLTTLKKAKAVDAQTIPTSTLDDYSYLAVRL